MKDLSCPLPHWTGLLEQDPAGITQEVGQQDFTATEALPEYLLGSQSKQLYLFACSPRDRSLRVRAKGPNRLERVSKELEPQRIFRLKRKQVEDVAPYRILTPGLHQRYVSQAQRLEHFGDLVRTVLRARLEGPLRAPQALR